MWEIRYCERLRQPPRRLGFRGAELRQDLAHPLHDRSAGCVQGHAAARDVKL